MWSKNKARRTRDEDSHIEAVKSLPCVICDTPGPCEAHEPVQGLWFCSIALCADCHRGSKNGLHGQKVMWRIKKWDEWDALNETLKRLAA